jgi:hypothetical protein
MKKLLLAVALIISTTKAQQFPLHIEAYEQNSKTLTGTLKPLQNVYVLATGTSVGSMTDVAGKTTLTFAQIQKATPLLLEATATDMEVVNIRDLRDVALGRFAPVKIYMAPKGRVDFERAELIHMSTAALTKTHDAYIARLRQGGAEAQAAIDELKEKTSLVIQDREQAERILNEQLEATKRRLPEFAEELARVNLDFASQMYRDAYACFKRGEIDSAIVILDEAKLDAAAAIAVAQMDSIDTQIAMLDTANAQSVRTLKIQVQSSILHAQAMLGLGDTASTIQRLLAISQIAQRRLPDAVETQQVFEMVARLYQITENSDSALWAQGIAVETIAKIPLSSPAQKQEAYLAFARSCLEAKLWLPAWCYAMRAESSGQEERSFRIYAVANWYLYRFCGR